MNTLYVGGEEVGDVCIDDNLGEIESQCGESNNIYRRKKSEKLYYMENMKADTINISNGNMKYAGRTKDDMMKKEPDIEVSSGVKVSSLNQLESWKTGLGKIRHDQIIGEMHLFRQEVN